MKNIKKAIIILTVVIIVGGIVSCDLFNQNSGQGTLVVRLPGSSARAASFEDFVETLYYQIVCVGSETISETFKPGDTATISLSMGTWVVTVKVFDQDGLLIGEHKETVNIYSGQTTSVNMNILIDTKNTAITNFILTGQENVQSRTTSNDKITIAITVPEGTDITELPFSVVHTGKKTSYFSVDEDIEGLPVSWDFSGDNDLNLKVMADYDEFAQDYIVKVRIFKDIKISREPNDEYTHGHRLNAEFAATVTYSNGVSDNEVPYKLADFNNNNITMHIGDEQIFANTQLVHIKHDKQKIKVTYGRNGDYGTTETVELLKVDKATRGFPPHNPITVTFSENMTHGTLNLAAHYAWTTPNTTIPSVITNQLIPAEYTDPSGNFYPAGGMIVVTVNKATGTWVPYPNTITYYYSEGMTLFPLLFPYAWVNPGTVITRAGDNQQFAATYTPSGNYLPAPGFIPVTVEKATGTWVPHPTEITVLYTPNMTLADITSPRLAANYEWVNPSTQLNAGTHQFSARYTHPSGNYLPADGNITVTVSNAQGTWVPYSNSIPISVNYTANMTTGNMTLADISLDDNYEWTTPSTVVNAGANQQFAAKYTDPSENYLPANGFITVNINKGTGEWADYPTLITVTYSQGMTLAGITLTGGYAWVTPSTVITGAGDGQEFEATYTNPNGNYLPVEGDIIVTVNKAPGTFPAHPPITVTYDDEMTLARLNSDLADGYEWVDRNTVINVGNNQPFAAIYTHPSGNYAPVNGFITVTVLASGGINITFPGFSDIGNPVITAPILYLLDLGDPNARPTLTTITVDNPNTYETGSIKWFLNNQQLTGSIIGGTNGGTLTVSTSTAPFNQIGTYSITVEVIRAGTRYTKIVTFDVKP